jgi:glycosyltransferase involved in cell wall biosynthesis
MKNPFISVIINCYNGERFLKEAIDSVYSQTYQNWEIIFWDNCSSDYSARIALNYDQKLNYYKSEITASLYEARNYALEKCKGDYIAFLDSDDLWCRKKLESQVGIINTKGVDIIYAGFDIINEKGRVIDQGKKKFPTGRITNYFLSGGSISIGSVLIKKELLSRHKFDSFYELLGDFDAWVFLSTNNSFYAINEVLEHSRSHEKNFSKILEEKWIVERRNFYNKFITRFGFLKYPLISYFILRSELISCITMLRKYFK